MKIFNITFLLLIALIKFIESCMRVTKCKWKDPCNKYKKYKDCISHKGCIIGKPNDSGVEVNIDIGDGNTNPNKPIPSPLVCVKKNFKQCYINARCAIF